MLNDAVFGASITSDIYKTLSKELTDAKEQSKRFDEEIAFRRQIKRPVTVKDKHLIAALEQGLPECSGMAIGLDRILMLMTGSSIIDEVLNFPIHRA